MGTAGMLCAHEELWTMNHWGVMCAVTSCPALLVTFSTLMSPGSGHLCGRGTVWLHHPGELALYSPVLGHETVISTLISC